MGKPRFSIGEFVCAVNHESSTLFYIYDYRPGKPFPYCIISMKKQQVYTAKARNLKVITNILNLITISLQNNGNSLRSVKNFRSARLRGDWIHFGHPLDWTLDLRTRPRMSYVISPRH